MERSGRLCSRIAARRFSQPNGTVAGAVLVLRDISALKERERFERRSRIGFTVPFAVRSAPDAIVVAISADIQSWNHAASSMFGYARTKSWPLDSNVDAGALS